MPATIRLGLGATFIRPRQQESNNDGRTFWGTWVAFWGRLKHLTVMHASNRDICMLLKSMSGPECEVKTDVALGNLVDDSTGSGRRLADKYL